MKTLGLPLPIILLLALASTAYAQTDEPVRDEPTPTDEKYRYNTVYDYSDAVPYRFNATELTRLAKSLVGTPYLSEGKEPSGFDCSGFTFYVFKQYGVYLPYFSSQQGEIGETISLTDAQPGDLILFKGYDLYGAIGHVGIVVSQKGEKLSWMHASSSKGVCLDNMANRYYQSRFVNIRRVAQ